MRTQRGFVPAIPAVVAVGTTIVSDVASGLSAFLAGRDPAREYRRTLRRYERAVGRLRSLIFVGALGAIASLVAAIAGTQPWWLVLTAISGWVGGTALVRLRRAEPPQPPPAWLPDSQRLPVSMTQLPRLRTGAPGGAETDRLARAESNLRRVLPAVAELHPSAARELRDAAAECGPVLHQQAARIVVLTGIENDMAGTDAATAAGSAARDVADRLGQGVDAYEQLLAAAVSLLAAPDLTRSPAATVGPAIDGLHAYAHGLSRAREADGG